MAFCWTTLHVKSMEASIEFYENGVGLSLQRRFKSPTGNEVAFLGFGDGQEQTLLELIQAEVPADYPQSDQISIGFNTEDLMEKKEVLEAMGVGLYKDIIQPNPSIRFFYVKDPDGISVQFLQWLNA